MLFQTVSQTGKAYFLLINVPLICIVISVTLQMKGTVNTLTFCYSDQI